MADTVTRAARGTGETVSLTVNVSQEHFQELSAAAEAADRSLSKMLSRAFKNDATRKNIIEAGK